MRKLFCLIIFLFPSLSNAEFNSECLGNCRKDHLFTLGDTVKPGRKYARDRLVDIQHLTLDVTPDFTKRSVRGTVTIRFAPVGQPLNKLNLDAMDLEMDAVSVAGATLEHWEKSPEQLVLNFSPPLPVGAVATLSVRYHGEPRKGLYFRTPEVGYAPEDLQVWSQGEAEFHRYWFPCYDYPNERFTSEVTCHVADGLSVISNGKLISQTRDEQGLQAWHWSQEQPHVNYLIALAAGKFHRLEAQVGKVPLALYVPPSETAQAEIAFRDTRQIMEFLQQEIGCEFPWDKYSQVYCLDFLAGGMENTSCSFMAVNALVPASIGELGSLRQLDAHEMAHQWFGDLLTCRDWAHIWLNEGFASYYTVLYEEAKNGRDGFLLSMRNEARTVIQSNDTRPMVWRDYGEPMQQFDARAYPRGAWVLHMLRSQLGKELYQLGIRTYIERHRNGIVTTDDLQDVLEEVSGKSLDQFFDQWVHHGGVPEMNAEYAWDEQQKLAKLTVRQTQKVDEKVLLFRLPVPVRFVCKENEASTVHDYTIDVSKAEEVFYFRLPKAPQIIRLDPELTVLAKWADPSPGSNQAELLKADFLTRLLTVGNLKEGNDETIAKHREVLKNDAHYAVRVESARTLQAIGTEAARNLLIENLQQPDERVRKSVVEALGALVQPGVKEALLTLIGIEKNPAILASAINALTVWSDFDPTPMLKVRSYHGMVVSSAIEALGNQRRQAALPAIVEALKTAPDPLPPGKLGEALKTIAVLSRDAKATQNLDFLTSYLNHPHPNVRIAAARALGELGDPMALPLLRSIGKIEREPSSAAANDAVAQIETRLKTPEPTLEAWKKFEALERKTAEMQKKLETLEKQAKPQ